MNDLDDIIDEKNAFIIQQKIGVKRNIAFADNNDYPLADHYDSVDDLEESKNYSIDSKNNENFIIK